MDYYEELGRPRISSILITHGHGDHIGGLDRLQDVLSCPVRCHPKLEPALTHRLGEGCVVPLKSREVVQTGGGMGLRALFTPGHEDDHVCYFMRGEKTLFSGDTILGNSSSSVRNLKQYMASLELLARQRPDMICPGHGNLVHNGTARIEWYIKHRQERGRPGCRRAGGGGEDRGRHRPAGLPGNLRKNLRNAAARNTRTHLEKLREEGRISEDAAAYRLENVG